MGLKIRVFGELASKVGSVILVEDKVVDDVFGLVDRVLREKNISLEDIKDDYVILLNGRVVKGKVGAKDGDQISILPIFFGGV